MIVPFGTIGAWEAGLAGFNHKRSLLGAQFRALGGVTGLLIQGYSLKRPEPAGGPLACHKRAAKGRWQAARGA